MNTRVNAERGIFFEPQLQKQVRERFHYVDEDYLGRKRLFFENSGGSLRLKSVVEAKNYFEQIPDCPERIHDTAIMLQEVKAKGISDVMQVMFGAKSGALVSELTASQAIFQITGVVVENVPGTNVVTTSIEHPSAYDAAEYYAKKTGKELRVAQANRVTGGVDVEEIVRHIDKDTCLLSVIYASNISGTILDMEAIVHEARKIKPDLHIISDAVQHAPHGVMDVDALQLDGINFAPYKAFGSRGSGFAYVSDRVAALRHHKLAAKDPSVWELGTPAPPNYAAISAVVDHICWIGSQFTDAQDRREQYCVGMERVHLQERALLAHLLDGTDAVPGLRRIPGVTVFLDTEDLRDRDLIVAMGIDGMDFTETVREYYQRGVTVYERVNTSLYSKRIVESLGLQGAVRVSPLHCHDTKDIETFLRITAEIAASR